MNSQAFQRRRSANKKKRSKVDLPDTIEAKRVVHERYKKEVDPDVRLPARVGFDLNDCEQRSLLDLLEREHGFRRDVPTMFISEAVMFGARMALTSKSSYKLMS